MGLMELAGSVAWSVRNRTTGDRGACEMKEFDHIIGYAGIKRGLGLSS